MSFITYPNFSGGGSGGGSATITYPLNGPAGSASAATFSVGGMGGLFSPSGGGVGLTSNGVAGLTLDTSGNVNLPKMLSVVGGASFSAITASGALSAASLGISGSASISQGLSAATLSASAGITGQSLNVQAGISGATLTLSGDAHVGNITSTGTFKAASIASTGPVYFPVSTADAPGIAGDDNSRNTGIYVDTNSGLGFSTAGTSVASIDAGGTFHIPNLLSAENITVGTQLIANAASIQSGLDVSGSLNSAGTLHVAQAVTFDGDLSVAGRTTLANFSVDTVNVQHNFSVAGQSSFGGSATFSAAVTAGAGLTVSGATTLADVSAGLGNFSAFRIEGTPDQGQSPVLSAGQRRFTATLGNNGDLAISGLLTVNNSAGFAKGLSAASLASSGAITAQGAVSGASLSGQTLSVAGKHVLAGQGAPNGSVFGSVGDEYTDTSAGALYLKISGSNTNTGWAAVSTAATGVSYPALAPDSSASTPSYAFSAATNYGLGHASSGLYLATAGVAALTLDASQNASLAAGLSVAGATVLHALTASGATSLQALSASGTASLQGLTATTGSFSAALSAASLSVSGTTSLSSASLSGSLSASGNVTGAVLFSGSTPFLTGSGSPQGAVSAPVGAFYTDTSGGGAWYKMAGTGASGWALFESGAPPAVAPAYPLAAPQSTTPQYAFQGGANDGMGSAASGSLYFSTGGTTAISVNSSQAVSLANALSVAGALSAQSTLSVSGASSLASASLTGTLTVQGLATLSGGASIPGSLSVGSSISAGTTLSAAQSVASGGAKWTSGSGAPTGSASDGDFYTDTKANDAASFYVRTAGAWKTFAFAGSAAPSQFPLKAPSDSASFPSYTWAAGSSNYGLYSPGTNQVGISTNSTAALLVDANQNVTLTAALSGQGGTFTQLSSTGGLTVANAGSFGGTLGVTGAATFSSTISSGAITSSGAVSGASGSFNGALSSGSLSVTNNASIGGDLNVSGTVTYSGISRSPYYQAGNGSASSPSYAFTAESGLGWYRSAAATLAAVAGGNAFATLSAASAVFAGTGSFGGTLTAPLVDTAVVRNSGGTLSLQAGTTTTLTLAPGSTSSAVPISVPAGSTSAPGLVVGASGGLSSANDARPTFPVSVSLTNPRGASLTLTSVPDSNTNSTYFIFAAGSGGISAGQFTPNGYANGSPGYIYQNTSGGSGTSLYVYEGTSSGNNGWVGVRTTSQPVVPSYPLVGPAGSASAVTFGVGAAGTGLFGGTDAVSRAFTGIAQGGTAVARFASFTNNSLPVYLLGLGDPTSSTVSGGLVASAQAPSTGAPAAFPGMVYQDTRGGAAQSLWVNESTTSTPAFAKVLTTSSPVSASFPLLAPADTATAPSYSWAAETGLGFYRSASATIVAVAAGAPLATLTTNLGTLPAALRVGGTNAGLTSPGANQLALQTAGATALSFSAAGIATFAFQSIFTAGTAALPSVAVSANNYGLYLSTAANQANEGSVSVSYKGKSVANYFQGAIGSTGNTYYAMTLGDASQTSLLGGIIAGASTPTGNITGVGGQLYQLLNGGVGQSVWVYEGTTSGTSGWAKLLTSTTTFAAINLTQTTAPSSSSGITKIYADTNGQLLAVSPQNAAIGAGYVPVLRGDIPALVLSSSFTLAIANSGETFCSASGTQYTITLPSSPAVDVRYRVQIETAAGVAIKAASGQIIYLGANPTSTAGTLTSVTVGSSVEIFIRAGATSAFCYGALGKWVTA